MAVLPVEVITSRSDTMDAVMMVLIVLALLLIVRACETGRTRVAAGGRGGARGRLRREAARVAGRAAGARACSPTSGCPGPRRRRLLQLAAAGAVYVVVALAWLTATLLVPAHDRPYAIGSTNGSAWNAAFVFNGTDRLGGKSPEPQQTVYEPGHRYPVATQSERDHIPIVPPSPTRLLARIGPLSGERLGLELLRRAAARHPGAARRLSAAVRDGRAATEPQATGRSEPSDEGRPDDRAPIDGADARCGAPLAAGLARVDADGHRAVQPHGPPAPALRGGLHAGGGRDARDRRRVGDARAAGARA